MRLVVGDEHSDALWRPDFPSGGHGEAAHGSGTVPTPGGGFNRPGERSLHPPCALPTDAYG
jgi:hypothetical protein